MSTPFRPLLVATAIAALLGVSACGPTQANQPAGTQTGSAPAASSSSAQVRPPVTVDPAAAAGRSYDLPLDSALVIQADEGHEGDWSGTAETPGIVEFTAGGVRDSATYNPGFKPLKAGSTKVTITNAKSGTSATFTITVIAAAS